MPLDISQKKNLIVFDIDGTLTDSVAVHQMSFVQALLSIGVKQIDTNFISFKHHTDSYISEAIFQADQNKAMNADDKMSFEQELTRFVEKEDIREIAGASKVLSDLIHNSDYGICFATGSLARPAQHKLRSIGIEYDERLLVTSDNIHERTIIVATAISQAKEVYGVDNFERIISVGDGLWDLKTAQEMGLEFIAIGDTHKELLLQHGALHWHADFRTFSIPE